MAGSARRRGHEIAAARHDIALCIDQFDLELVPAGRGPVRPVGQHVPGAGVVEHERKGLFEPQPRTRSEHASPGRVREGSEEADLELDLRRAEADAPAHAATHGSALLIRQDAVREYVGTLGRIDNLLLRGVAGVVVLIGEDDDEGTIVIPFAETDRAKRRVVEGRLASCRNLRERAPKGVEIAGQRLPDLDRLGERDQRHLVLPRQSVEERARGLLELFELRALNAAAHVEHEVRLERHLLGRHLVDLLLDAVVEDLEVAGR